MIELRDDALVFSFPEVHPSARLTVGFQRTLRIPDDERSYPLPPLAGLLLAALLAGCGDAEALPDAAPRTAALATGDVWSRLPPDSLYGATAAENLRTVQVVIDALRIPAGWNGMRIAAISDLQLGLWPDNEEVAAEAVRRSVAAHQCAMRRRMGATSNVTAATRDGTAATGGVQPGNTPAIRSVSDTIAIASPSSSDS